MIILNKKNRTTTSIKFGNGIPYISFNALEQTGMVVNAFSTRQGGVSVGRLESMNLGFNRGDLDENVLKNHKIFAKAVGFPYENIVTTNQTHTTNVRVVTKEDCGKGITKYNTDGTCDGVIVKMVSDFFRIEYDSKYNQKMEKLIETDTFEDSVEIDSNAVFDSAIKSAIIKNFVVSIELLHSGNENITGLPLSLENGICTVRQIDDYGCDDGVTSFVFNTATQITINAKYEKLLSSLMNK